MAKRKKIIWTKKAQIEKIDLLKFWLEKNKSITYPSNLNKLINSSLDLISLYPNLGKQTDVGSRVRVKSIKHFDLFYKISDNEIIVLSIWDTRRNPDDVKF